MKLLILILPLFLLGCSHFPKKDYIQVPTFTPVVCEDYGRIEPVKTLPVIFVRGKDAEGNIVLGLRGDQYSHLSINIIETLRYIVEQKKAIGYYKKCIEDHNSIQRKEEGEPAGHRPVGPPSLFNGASPG